MGKPGGKFPLRRNFGKECSILQVPPLLFVMIWVSVLRSTPALTPSMSASPTSPLTPREIMLLTIFVAAPAPLAPQYTTLSLIASRIGRHRSRTARSPPTIRANRRDLAPSTPPDTGESSTPPPTSRPRATIFRTVVGEFGGRS